MKKWLSISVFLLVTGFSLGQTRPVESIRVAKAPYFSALSADGSKLFVTAFADNEVQVIDLTTHKATTRFYGGYEPVGIVSAPTGDKLFVTNLNNGLVKVIDANTFDILDDINVGGMASNITVSPKGFLAFVTNFGRGKIGRIDFIDTTSHRIVAEVEVGVRPLAAAVSPLGDQLYVVCAGSNDLWIIDVNQKTVLKTIPVGLGPDGVAISPDGLTLYVANSGTNDLSVIDLLDQREVRRVRVGNKPFSVAVAQDGRIFVVETGDRTVSIYSPDFKKLETLRASKKPIDVTLSPDDRYAYVTDEDDNRLLVFQISAP